MSELPSGDDPVTFLEMLAELARLLKTRRSYNDNVVDPDYRRDAVYARLTEIVVEHAKLVADRDAIDTIDNWLGLGAWDREIKLMPMPNDKPCVAKILDAYDESAVRVSGKDWPDCRAQLAGVIKARKHASST